MSLAPGISPKARRKARVFALQALYQWSYTQEDLNPLETQYLLSNNHHKVDWTYFSELLHGVPEYLNDIDDEIRTAIDRPFIEINPIELTALRLAIFECRHMSIPAPVVMNEYIDITREYGAEEGHRFVNGVLDKLTR
jgi:N utilization substance protein B